MSAKSIVGGGIVVVTIVLALIITRSTHKAAEAKKLAEEVERQRAAEFAQAHPIIVEFPTSGEGHATQEVGIKAWLDPKRTFTRPSGPAKYVFAEDTSLFFNDTEGAKVDRTKNRTVWQEMPEGKYVVYPLERDKIWFKWWQ